MPLPRHKVISVNASGVYTYMYMYMYIYLSVFIRASCGQMVTVIMKSTTYAEQGTPAFLMCNYSVNEMFYTFNFLQWHKETDFLASFTKGSMQPYYPPEWGDKYFMTTDSIDSSSVLTVSSVQFSSDEGRYICRVQFRKSGTGSISNDTSTLVNVIDEVNITYKVDNMEGANDRTDAVLTCIARGNPEPVMVWCETNGTEIGNSSRSNSSKFIVTMEVSDGDEVYGYEVTSYLTIKKVDSQVDYRVYVCNSSSGIGKEDKLEIILHGTRLPDMPRKVKITNRTAESLTVVWSGVFNGGEVQSFRVSYLKTSKEVFSDQTGERPTSTATGLDEYTKYEIRVYAKNIIGENNKYASIKGYTLPSPTTTPPSGNTGIIVGAVVGGVILIAIVISLATYIVRMSPEAQKGGKKTTGAFYRHHPSEFVMDITGRCRPRPTCTSCIIMMIGLLSTVVLSGYSVAVTIPPYSYGDQGHSATVNCSYKVTESNYSLSRIQWRKGDADFASATTIATFVNGLGATPTYPIGDSKYAMSIDSVDSSNILTVNSLQYSNDGGKYWCFVLFQRTGYANKNGMDSTLLSVVVLPTSIALSDSTETYPSTGGTAFLVEGVNHRFNCTVAGINPRASFSWSVGGRDATEDNSNDIIAADGLTTSSSTVTLSPVWINHGETLLCQASNKDGHAGISGSLTLDIKVPPKSSSMTLFDANGVFTPGGTVMVDQDASHVFTCQAQSRPAAIIQWDLGSNSYQQSTIGPTTGGPGDGLVYTTSMWTFTPGRDNHRQQVKCEANTTESQPPLPSVMVTLDVNGPPSIPVITGSSSMTENVLTTLSCTADGGYPDDWSLVWFNGGSSITGPTTSSSASGSRYSFLSTLNFTPVRQDNDNIITCAARRSSGTPGLMGSLGPIDVQFCSERVSVSCPLSAASGSIEQLSCQSDSSNPATALVWSKNNVVQTSPAPVNEDGNYGGYVTTLRLTTGALTKADNGATYKCCVMTTLSCTGTVCDFCVLNVEYPPDFSVPTLMPTRPVEEGDTVILFCGADANPKPINFITWERVGSLDSLPSVYSDGTSNLTLSSITKEQAGSYRCRGNNGVPPVVHSSSVDVIVHYGVEILNKNDTSVGANTGFNATLVCVAKGHPLPRMTWQGPDGVEITNQTNPGRIFQVDTIIEGDDVYGFIIRSIVKIIQVTPMGDYGSYTCNSGNGIGMVDTLTIVLNDKVKPLPPEDVSVNPNTVTESSVRISWRPGNDGGEAQWFFVNYREVETTAVFDPDTQTRIDDDVFEYVIEGLLPYTLYEIEIFAENQNGVGKSVKQNFRTRPDTPKKLGIVVTTNQETGSISVDGIPQDGDASTCLQIQARLMDQSPWFNYGGCLETNTDLAIQEVRSSYCRNGFCSLATSALSVRGQSSNAGLIAGLVILAIIALISITVNIVTIRDIRRSRGLQGANRKRVPKESRKHTPEGKRAVINEAVEYQDLDVPLQVLAVKSSSSPSTSAYASISETVSAFSRDKLTIERELGQGAFGKVLLAKASGIVQLGTVTQVAVKTLRDDADLMERGDLLRELDFMKQLSSHANVVKLLGFCDDGDPIFIIMEYMTKGPLKDLLTSSRGKGMQVYSNLHGRSKSLTSRDLIKFAKDVADGMAFLASQQCIHRDLAARNVLVGENMVCKVSDFGLARDIKNKRMYQRQSEGRLPIRWMALESVVDDIYTTESDVWSYGILLWEIVTLGARPYPTMSAKTMITKLQEGYRMPRPDHCQDEIYQMMLTCWEEESTARPSFTEIGQKLEKALESPHECITLSDYQGIQYEVTIPDSPDERI